MIPNRYWSAACVLTLSVGLIRCSADDQAVDGLDGSSGGQGGNSSGDSTDGRLGDDGDPTKPTDGQFNPLCGDEDGVCVPDRADACSGMGGMGGEAAAFGGAGGGVTFNPGDLASTGVSCQITIDLECDSESCGAQPACLRSGASREGEPCVAASDCAAGLACVGESVSGICRPYCCEGTEASCDKDHFCDERRLLETPELYVPVCLPVEACSLTDPYPCPEGKDCACQGKRACIVVRDDGATACAEPGIGQAGDNCSGTETGECAHGYVCSPSAGCMKLCSTVSKDSGCPDGGVCQSPAEFADDLGLCVGVGSGSSATK